MKGKSMKMKEEGNNEDLQMKKKCEKNERKIDGLERACTSRLVVAFCSS